MMRALLTLIVALTILAPTPARAHPAPFTYLDLRLADGRLDVSIVAHIFDVAHDLQIDPPDRLLDQAFVGSNSAAIATLLRSRLSIAAGDLPLESGSWSNAEALPDRQSVRLTTAYTVPAGVGVLRLTAWMFPYDPAHQSFVNVYEQQQLTLQALLDASKPDLDYYLGSRQGRMALARRFVPVGIRHIAFGVEHLLFLVGLTLLGGTARTFVRLGAAFVAANVITYALFVFDIVRPPGRIIEPAIALAVIYVGADNLMVRGGRDMRSWIAVAFGVIHGFWFANGLRVSDLPPQTMSWSLLCFDAGVQLAQLSAIFVGGLAVVRLYEKKPAAARRVATVGSVAVIAGGVIWFVQRVFFPGGL